MAAASLADFFTSSFAGLPSSDRDASRASAALVELSETESPFAENLLETLPKIAPMIKAAAMRNRDDKMNITMIRYPTFAIEVRPGSTSRHRNRQEQQSEERARAR